MNDWKSIDEFVLGADTNMVHVDTRDFYVMQETESIDLRDHRYPEISKCIHNDDYMIDGEKIKDFLKHIEDIAGGKAKWRCLNFDIDGCRYWELKYIRMYKIKKTGKFIVCNRNQTPIKWRDLNETNIDKGAIEDGLDK